MTFDPNKPYRRRDGKPAKVVHTWPYNGRHLVVSGDQYYTIYRDGTIYNDTGISDGDLINIPEKIEGWVRIYKSMDGRYYVSGPLLQYKDPKLFKRDNVNSCIYVSFEVGEGLE